MRTNGSVVRPSRTNHTNSNGCKWETNTKTTQECWLPIARALISCGKPKTCPPNDCCSHFPTTIPNMCRQKSERLFFFSRKQRRPLSSHKSQSLIRLHWKRTTTTKMLPRTKREFWSIGLSKKKTAYPTFSNFSFNNDRSSSRHVQESDSIPNSVES